MAVAVTLVNSCVLAVVLARQAPMAAQGEPGVVRAQAMELVDSSGRVRAQINVETDGEVVLRMRDRDGAVRKSPLVDAPGTIFETPSRPQQ